MQIDAHQHFWLYNSLEYAWIDNSMAALRRNFLPNDLAGELKSAGFDGSIAVQARQSMEETRWLLELARKSASIIGVVGWIDLRSPDVRSQLQSLAHNPKLVGVRHIVQSEPDDGFLLQPDFLRGISVLEQFDLAYDLLIYTKHLPVAIEFVRKFPRQRLVVDHLAKPPIKSGELHCWAVGIRELAKFPNVYCKVSGLVTEADWQRWRPDQIRPFLDVAFESFGPERLMIGSDWPVCLVAASYTTTIQLTRDYIAMRSPGSLSAVLGENAARFYGLRF
jgi:L-fuconolactonase